MESAGLVCSDAVVRSAVFFTARGAAAFDGGSVASVEGGGAVEEGAAECGALEVNALGVGNKVHCVEDDVVDVDGGGFDCADVEESEQRGRDDLAILS